MNIRCPAKSIRSPRVRSEGYPELDVLRRLGIGLLEVEEEQLHQVQDQKSTVPLSEGLTLLGLFDVAGE